MNIDATLTELRAEARRHNLNPTDFALGFTAATNEVEWLTGWLDTTELVALLHRLIRDAGSSDIELGWRVSLRMAASLLMRNPS